MEQCPGSDKLVTRMAQAVCPYCHTTQPTRYAYGMFYKIVKHGKETK